MKNEMNRATASKIATGLIEGGIRSHHTNKCVAEQCATTVECVKEVKRYLLKHATDGNGKLNFESLCSYADAIENGWADEELNLTK